MPLDLTTRSGKGSPVSAVESDQNLTDIQTLVNAIEVLVSDEDVDALATSLAAAEVDIDDAESDIVGHTADIADHETRVTANEAHAALSSGNPHSVNKANTGLGNVTNHTQVKAIDFDQVLMVGKHGNDSYNGASHQEAFLTFGAAITAAIALTPSSTNRIAIRCIDAADYTENLTVPSWCGIMAPAIKLTGNHILNDNCLLQSFRLIASSGTAVKKNVGTGAATVVCPRMIVSNAAHGLVCETGTVNYVGQSVEVENGVGFGFESTAVIHLTVNTIEITGTGKGIGLEAAGKVVALCGNISDDGSGVGISVESGGTVNITMADLVCDTAYNVDATSTLNLICSYLSGTETNLGTANVLTGDHATSTDHDNQYSDLSHAARHTDGNDDIQNATNAQKGVATAAQITALEANVTKLAGIEANATIDQTGAEIKTAYEGEANAYTDTKNTKLAGVETAADVTDAVNVASSIAGQGSKATPLDADAVGLVEATSGSLFVLTWANIKATIKTYFDTLYHSLTTVGIADDNLVEIDDADAADDDYAKFTANGLEGRSYAEVKADLGLEDADINALIVAQKLDDLATPDDNTDLDASLTAHGLLLKLGGGTTNFLRADGTWASPSGGTFASIKIGTYTGSGATSYAVTGIGFAPLYVQIWRRPSGSGFISPSFQRLALAWSDLSYVHKGTTDPHGSLDDTIIAMGADGFTVDDAGLGSDSDPNKFNETYDYICLG